jgi:8-oxo-dGTP pyrophosphatase MutT (NUDIX family)
VTEQRYVAHGLIETGGRFLLLQRGEGRYLGGYWDIPGGTV